MWQLRIELMLGYDLLPEELDRPRSECIAVVPSVVAFVLLWLPLALCACGGGTPADSYTSSMECEHCDEGQACVEGICYNVTCEDEFPRGWDGCTIGVPSEFRVNHESVGNQDNSFVSSLNDNGLLTVWTSGPSTNSDTELLTSIWSGGCPASEDSVVATAKQSTGFPDGEHIRTGGGPTAVFADGSFVVVWEVRDDLGTPLGVFGQEHDSQGHSEGSIFEIRLDEGGGWHNPAATSIDANSLLVVAQARREEVSEYGDYLLLARLFEHAGEAEATPQIDIGFSLPGCDFSRPVSLRTLEEGRFGVTCTTAGFQHDAHFPPVFGALFSVQSGVLGQIMAPTEPPCDDCSYSLAPSLSSFGDHGCAVVWQVDTWPYSASDARTTAIVVQTFDQDGLPHSSPVSVRGANGVDVSGPQVVQVEDSVLLVIWSEQDALDEGQIRARRVDVSDGTLGPIVTLNLFPWGRQSSPAIAAAGLDRWAVIWSSHPAKNGSNMAQDGDAGGIFMALIDSHGQLQVPCSP